MIDSLYFDSHTITRPFPEVLEKFFRFSKEYWASSASPYFLGQQQIFFLQKSIESLFKELGVQDLDEIFFTSSGEESFFQVFFTTYLQRARESGKTLMLISETEETKAFAACKQLEDLGCSFKEIPVNSKGQVTPEALESAITPRTALFSLSWANGLTGVLHPIADLAEICKRKGVLFHLDASYVFGKSFFRFQDLDVDFLTLDGSVLHAPKETGLTIVKSGIKAASLIPGKIGESTASIAAFTRAIEMVQEKFEFYCMEGARLRDKLENEICKRCSGAQILFKDSDRLPTCSVIAFPPIHAESMLFLLNSKGVYASRGGGKFPILSQLLKASHVEDSLCFSALSFSCSCDITEDEIDRAVDIIVECFNQLKECAGDL